MQETKINILLFKTFDKAVRWSVTEGIVYYTMLAIHHGSLWLAIDSALYGTMGLFFSTLYSLVTILNLGFDRSLAPFSLYVFSSKETIFKRLCIYQIIVLSFLCFCVFFIAIFFLIPFPIALTGSILLLSEIIKRNFRVIAHLAFLHKQVAFIEIFYISSYTTLIWLFYYSVGHLTFLLLVIPLIIISLFSNFLLFKIIRTYKNALFINSEKCTDFSYSTYFKNRFFIFINQCSHLLFSSNILIPLFAYNHGIKSAGEAYLVTMILLSGIKIIQSSIGSTCEALFARITSQGSLTQKHIAHSNSLIFSIKIIIFISFFVVPFLLYLAHSTEQQLFLILFLILYITESIFFVGEQQWIVYGKSKQIMFLNSICFLLCAFIFYASGKSMLITISSIFVLRILSMVLVNKKYRN